MSKNKKDADVNDPKYAIVVPLYHSGPVSILKDMVSEWNAARTINNLLNYTLDPAINGGTPNINVHELEFKLEDTIIPITNPHVITSMVEWSEAQPTTMLEYLVVIEPVINLHRMMILMENFVNDSKTIVKRIVTNWTEPDGSIVIARFAHECNVQIFRNFGKGGITATPNSLAFTNSKLPSVLDKYGDNVIHISQV